MSSRSLDDLHPEFRTLANLFLQRCAGASLDVLVYCTLRSAIEQSVLYAQGRTTPGAIVTNAPAGESAHQYGLAFDAVPMNNGKPCWDSADPHWQLYGSIAENSGLEWAGAPSFPFREFPHCQMPNWRLYAKPAAPISA